MQEHSIPKEYLLDMIRTLMDEFEIQQVVMKEPRLLGYELEETFYFRFPLD